MDIKSLKGISPTSDLSSFLSTDDSVSSCSSFSLDLSQDSIETVTKRHNDVDKSNMKGLNCVDFIKDPSLLVSFNKLLAALGDFGFESGSVRKEEILRSLQITDEGLVPFGEFVKCIEGDYRLELTKKLAAVDTKTVLSEDVATERLLVENETLREENKNMKQQFAAMEGACSKAEDELIRIRKELQLQLENVRNLTMKLREKSEVIKNGRDEDRTKETMITNNVSDRRGRRMSTHQEAASKLLNFVEEVHRKLSEVKRTNGRVGRSCSLYKNASCTLASKRTSSTPQPRVVARAATAVGSPSRVSSNLVSEKNNRPVVDHDRLPRYVKTGRGNLDQSQMIRKIVVDAGVIIDTLKPVVNDADVEVESSSENINYFESSASAKNVSDVIKRLHPNIPSSAVVTIMTRV